jgi:hypothetical protein
MGGYRLDGRNPLSYMGVKPSQPPQLLVRNAAPTANDVQNLVIGTLWVVQQKSNPAQSPEVYMLVNQEQNQAVWIQIYPGMDTGAIETITGNSGGAVGPDSANPANINILGSGVITVVGNPGTNTLTVTPSGAIASSFPTQSGTAVPSAGALTINGSGVISTSGSGSTVTITPSGAIASSFITNPATGTATPSSGVLTFAGSGSTTVSAAGSTITIASTDTGTTSFPTDSGTATPTAGAVNVLGGTAGRDINTSASGSTIHVDLKNAITLGDLSAISAASPAITLASGDLYFSGNNQSATTNQFIRFDSNGSDIIISFFLNNIFMGSGTGNTTMTAGQALFNIGIGNNSMAALTTGARNTALGENAFGALTTGSNNIALGYAAFDGLTTGSQNTQVGASNVASGITTGSNNTLIGFGAGDAYTGAESNNILIGSGVTGVVGESDKTKIGGIRGTTTTNADAIAVLIDSAGQLGTVSSSIRFKDNVQDMGDDSSPLMNLRPVTFEYKSHPGIKQYGLIAEEVAEHMPRLVAHDKDGNVETVKYHEIAAILLNEVQKLSKRVEELEKGCLCQK